MRTQHNLLLEKTAEKIKIQIGAAIEDLETPPEYVIQGRDLLTGKPKQELKFLIEKLQRH
jgi:rod shape-determining protein MreB